MHIEPNEDVGNGLEEQEGDNRKHGKERQQMPEDELNYFR